MRDSRDARRRNARLPPLAAVDTHREAGAEGGDHRAEQAAQVAAAEHSATRRTDPAGERIEGDAALLTSGLYRHAENRSSCGQRTGCECSDYSGAHPGIAMAVRGIEPRDGVPASIRTPWEWNPLRRSSPGPTPRPDGT